MTPLTSLAGIQLHDETDDQSGDEHDSRMKNLNEEGDKSQKPEEISEKEGEKSEATEETDANGRKSEEYEDNQKISINDQRLQITQRIIMQSEEERSAMNVLR